MKESRAVKRSIADGELSIDDVNRLRNKDIAFDKVLGVAAKRGATIDKKVQRGYGVDQLKNGTVNWTPSRDMGAAKYFMGARNEHDTMSALFGETPGPRAGKGWVASGEHKDGGTSYSFYGDPAYVQKRKDQAKADAAAAAQPAAAATPAAATGTGGLSAGGSSAGGSGGKANFDLSNYSQNSESWSPDEPTFQADTTPAMYQNFQINQQSQSVPVGNVWDNSWDEGGGKRFAASSKFREALDQRLGVA